MSKVRIDISLLMITLKDIECAPPMNHFLKKPDAVKTFCSNVLNAWARIEGDRPHHIYTFCVHVFL